MAGFGPWAFLAATQSGEPLTEPLIDNTPLGSAWVRVNYHINSAATNIPIQLGRTPSGAHTLRTNNGAVLYQTDTDVSQSGPSVFVCRATVSNTIWTGLIL